VFGYSAVLTFPTEEAAVGSDTSLLVEHFNGGCGNPDIHLTFNVLIGDGVIHALHRDVVVELNCCFLPLRQLIAGLRKRCQQWEFFLHVDVVSRTVFLLKWLPTELKQLLSDRCIQLRQGEELLVPEGGNNPCRDDTYCAFGIGLIFRGSDPGGNNGAVIILRHFMVDCIDLRIIPVSIVHHSGLAVIGHEDLGYASEVFKHMNMGADPGVLLFIDEAFHIRVLAVTHDSNEQKHLCHFTGVRVNNVGWISCPVHLDLLSGFSGDVHRSTAPLLVLLDIIAELRVHKGLISRQTAFLQILGPEQLLVDTVSHQLFVDIIEVWHPLGWAYFWSLGEQSLFQDRVRQGVVKGPGDIMLLCRFQDLVYGLFGDPAARCDARLTEIHAV